MSDPQANNQKKDLAEKTVIDGVVYYGLPIDVAIKYSDKIHSGFFIPLNADKRVRIELGDGDIREKMMNYRDKGLDKILFAEDDYYKFLKMIKRGLTGFFMKDDEANKTLTFDQIIFLVNKASTFIGLPKEYVTTGEDVCRKVIDGTKTTPKIHNLLKPYIQENQDEFLKNLLVSYVGMSLVDALNWTTPQIKEKVVQAALYGDLTLTSDDYMKMIISNGNRERWTEEILTHPLKAAKVVKSLSNPPGREVIRAIEQHQEMPDGSGYPKGLKGLSIEPFSSMIIVGRHYIESVIESDFAYDDRKTFIDGLLKVFEGYSNFTQPSKALYAIFGITNE